jgi:hypothetical protein
MFKFRSFFINYNKKSFRNLTRSFGAGGHGHGHDELHVPEVYDRVGKGLLIFAYLWIMYRFKEDKGQIFGFYKPWLDEHEHEHHRFIDTAMDKAPTYVEEEDEDDEDHEDGDEEEEE